MNQQELQNQVDVLTQKIKTLETQAIGVKIDPQTSIYLTNFINGFPTQTYSASAPSGTSYVVGSLWLRDTGLLATNTIHVWTGSTWNQLK